MPAGRPAPVVAAHPLRSAACHRCHPHFYTAISRAKLQGGTRKVSKKNFYRFSAFWLRSKEYFENAFGPMLEGWGHTVALPTRESLTHGSQRRIGTRSL